MKKLISSALLTVVAVPFLMAAPLAKKAQNGTATTAPATATKKTKKHVKKAKAAAKPAATATAPAK